MASSPPAVRLARLIQEFDELPRADRQEAHEVHSDNLGSWGRGPQRVKTQSAFEGYEMHVIEAWAVRAEAALIDIFTKSDSRVERFQKTMNEGGWNQINRRNIALRLRGVVEAASRDASDGSGPIARSLTDPAQTVPSAESRRIFLVHGQDEAAKESVARFVTQLGLEPVILHEQTNRGQTIIEKFEEHSNVAFAVILLTPDDVGYLAAKPRQTKPRARQNVVFEFGYFVAKLGRGRVCVLHKGEVEFPSDTSGVVYVRLEADWRIHLAKEMKAAGIQVDLNLVM